MTSQWWLALSGGILIGLSAVLLLWLNGRIAEIRQELVMLAPEERKVWVDRAIQELSAKGALSAIIVRRASQGDVLHGLLGSVVVRLYASATHGEDWNQPPASLLPPPP